MNLHRPVPRRRPVELSLDEGVVEDARALGLDVEALAETALRESVSREKARRWREENAEAIAFNNAQIEKDGLWCDDYRLF